MFARIRLLRPVRQLLAVGFALLVVSGCSSPSAETSEGVASPANTTIDGSGLGGHVHHLAFSGDRLLIGTHDGLYAQSGSQSPSRISNEIFDVMGLAVGEQVLFASGHPGPGMQAPNDLGLMASTDAGKTWTNVSLSGEADFHRLVVTGTLIAGISSTNGHLLTSQDSGRTWTDLGRTTLYDIAFASADGSIMIGTSEQGPMRSIDGGKTFTPIAEAPLLALLAVTESTLFSADVRGGVFESRDAGVTWTAIGSLPGQPIALAASDNRLAALVENTIFLSTDSGRSFNPYIVDIAGH